MTTLSKRQERVRSLADTTWDVVIIGGGITGAGVFRQSCLDGLKTLLIEKNDFASGTSWCSSKLIHGGLRYLEQFNLKLVLESVREKKYLQTHASELVQPLTFVFPVFETDKRPLWMVHLGTWLYALLSGFSTFPRHRSPRVLSTSMPHLTQEGLTGAISYTDAQTIDAYLTIANIMAGCNHQGKAFNHMQALDYHVKDDQISSVSCVDTLTQTNVHISAKQVIDATGPWANLPYKDPQTMTFSKGSHVLLEGNPFELSAAVTMTSPDDGRVMFCIPWMDHTLVGTTDVMTEATPDDVMISEEEKTYILKTLQMYFPNVPITSSSIKSSFAGLRAMIHDPNKPLSQVSRDHHITTPLANLVCVYGGKLTCFASMALQIMHAFQKKRNLSKSKRHHQHLPTYPMFDASQLTKDNVRTLIHDTHARTVADVLIRRTLANLFCKDHGAHLIDMVTETLEEEMHYTQDMLHTQIEQYWKQSQQSKT